MSVNDKQSVLHILGANNEALSAAVVMASLRHRVVWSVDKQQLNKLVKQYAFEHQLIALWQLYRHDGAIQIVRDIDAKNIQTLWLFLDEVIVDTTYAESLACKLEPPAKVIISGGLAIGAVSQFAQRLKSPLVFYLPFVFLKDGASFTSMINPHLLIVGEKTKHTLHALELIAPIINNASKTSISNIINTEFARASIMAMLASRLSFMNEMARLADALCVDINEVKRTMGMDARIGDTYLNPSWGFGGQALPNALNALEDDFARLGVNERMINAIAEINEDQKELIFRKFWQYYDSFIDNKTVLIWGAGYKSGSGRTLNSAIHPLLQLLWHHGVTTYIYDSHAAAELSELYDERCKLVNDAYARLHDVDALFILSWPDVTMPNIKKLAKSAVSVFDAQNLLTDEQITQLAGFYTGIGRGLHTSKGQA